MSLEKLRTKDEIKCISEQLREQGKMIVTTNGSFDLFHAGHARFLKEAKKQGDILIVGLNSDKSVKSYKGHGRPIIDGCSRAEVLDAIRYVDYIVFFDEPEIAVPLIKLVKPHVHCNGSEYGGNCVEAPFVKMVGARLHLIKEIVSGENKEKLSTSGIIRKIKGEVAKNLLK